MPSKLRDNLTAFSQIQMIESRFNLKWQFSRFKRLFISTAYQTALVKRPVRQRTTGSDKVKRLKTTINSASIRTFNSNLQFEPVKYDNSELGLPTEAKWPRGLRRRIKVPVYFNRREFESRLRQLSDDAGRHLFFRLDLCGRMPNGMCWSPKAA